MNGEETFVEVTLEFRAQLHQNFKTMVVVSVDGSGNPIGFLPDDETIFVVDHDFGGRIDLAGSFEKWLERILETGDPG